MQIVRLRRVLRARRAEDVRFVAAARADEGGHVLDDAEDLFHRYS